MKSVLQMQLKAGFWRILSAAQWADHGAEMGRFLIVLLIYSIAQSYDQ